MSITHDADLAVFRRQVKWLQLGLDDNLVGGSKFMAMLAADCTNKLVTTLDSHTCLFVD